MMTHGIWKFQPHLRCVLIHQTGLICTYQTGLIRAYQTRSFLRRT